VSNSASQSSFLVATAAADDYFGIAADFELTAPLDPAGGAVCFSSIDCVAWGSYAGDTTSTGPPFSPQTGLAGMAMKRDVSGGSRSNLDAGDDTNDSAADFDPSDPTPTNNAGQTGSPGAGPPPPTDETAPVSFVVKPADSKVYGRAALASANGSASDEVGVTSVRVGLRKTYKNGKCRWWNGQTFVARACGKKILEVATGTTDWSFDMPSLAASTGGAKLKHYTIFSSASDAAGNDETAFERGRNMNRFEVSR
jgi:hypothetical protein